MIRHVPCGRCMPTASCRAVACSLTRAAPHTPGKLNWPCCCRRSRCLRRPVILRPPSPPCALATTSLGRAELGSRAMGQHVLPACPPLRARALGLRQRVCNGGRLLATQRHGTFATEGRRGATQCSAAPLDCADVERVVPKVHRLDLRSSEHFRKLPTGARHTARLQRRAERPRAARPDYRAQGARLRRWLPTDNARREP
jgi:hypothetical protein